MVEWFGMSSFGPSDHFKDMMRSDYEEPKRPLDLRELEARGQAKKPFYNLISELDVYIKRIDGYGYGSHSRLDKMRKKGCFKPVGPLDMYKYPGVTSMDIGWWTSDEALQGDAWYRPRNSYFKPTSENTRFVDYALQVDKTFRM